MPDSIVKQVQDELGARSEVGQRKYGTTLDRKDLSPVEWIEHLRQELMDATLYATRLKQDMERAQRCAAVRVDALKIEAISFDQATGFPAAVLHVATPEGPRDVAMHMRDLNRLPVLLEQAWAKVEKENKGKKR